VGEMHLLIANL